MILVARMAAARFYGQGVVRPVHRIEPTCVPFLGP